MKQLLLLLSLGAALSASPLRAQSAEPIFHEGFDSQADFEKWTIVNVEEGSATWSYRTSTGKPMQSKCAQILKHTPNAAEDWLISPDITLDATKVYEVSFRMTPGTFNKTERLKAYAGQGKTAAAMTELLTEVIDVIRGDEVPVYRATFQPTVSGVWNLGFLGCSEPEKGRIDLDDITVTELAGSAAPGKVTGLTATAGAGGELTATLNFTAPTTDAAGGALTAITEITITRNGETIRSIAEPTPGATLSYTDTSAAAGVNVYGVTASNGNDVGETETCSVFVGPDVTKGVTDARATLTAEGILLSWSAPTESQHGGWFDPSALTYKLTLGEESIDAGSATTYLYNVAPTAAQRVYEFSIEPVSTAGVGESATFRRIAAGEPVAAPYSTSFAGGTMPELWYQDSDCAQFGWLAADPSDEEWSDPDIKNYTIYAVDGDAGDLIADNYYHTATEESRLVLPLMRLDGLTAPVARFYVLKGEEMPLRLQISVEGGEWQELPASEWAEEAAAQRWYECMVPLSGYAGRTVQLGLLAHGGTRRIHIDNFRIEEAGYSRDLLVRGAKVFPARVLPGETSAFTASVRNLSNRAESDYHLRLVRDGEEVAAMAGPSLAPGETGQITFNYTATYADQYADKSYWRIELKDFDADERPSNNSSEEVRWSARSSEVPVTEGLSATVNASKTAIDLTWSAAADVAAPVKGEPVSVTDDFESYEPFLKDEAGDWTMVDGDGVPTWSAGYPDYQHKGEAMAFQVFNTELGGVQTDEHIDNIFFARSGKQYLLSVANEDMSEPMDDWLISPRLDGRSQTVTFYAGQPQDFGTHAGIKVGYSTGDNDPDSFIIFGDGAVYDVQDGWRSFSFELPDGARYFAINVVRTPMFLKIDDITYQAHDGQADALTVRGYNLYRDGVRLNDSLLTEARYTDSEVNAVTTYSYRVSTVYEQGESAWSEPVEATIGATGVTGTTVAGNSIRLVSGGIELLSDVETTVYTADGIIAARADKAGMIRLPKGLYVIVTRHGAIKATVK